MKKHIFIALSIFAFLFASCDNEVSVTGVTLDQTNLAIPEKGTATLVATIEPSEAVGIVKWSSSNEAVATVENGVVTGLTVGTTQITANVGAHSATCEVAVSAEITSLTLNNSKIRLKIDSVATLTASLLPAQSAVVSSNLSWISTNPSVATVDKNGKITAVSLGTANIVASIGSVTAFCSVTVYDFVPPSLAGTNYNLIYLDAATIDIIGSSNIITDFRPDGINSNLYIWNGLNAATTNGTNFYGNTDWLSFAVTGAGGWSGAAFNIKPNAQLDKLKAITDDTSGKYYLHFAIKSSTTNSYAFKLGYGASSTTLVLGTATMESTLPFGNFTRNGEWQEVEVPMNYFKAKGLRYTTGMATTDIFVMLAGGTSGVKLEIDAVFIYKKP